jgi:hypothetical protein
MTISKFFENNSIIRFFSNLSAQKINNFNILPDDLICNNIIFFLTPEEVRKFEQTHKRVYVLLSSPNAKSLDPNRIAIRILIGPLDKNSGLFNQAAVKFANSVVHTNLPNFYLKKIFELVPKRSLTQQIHAAETQLAAEAELQSFYKVFKERIKDLNVNENEYVNYVGGALSLVTSIGKKECGRPEGFVMRFEPFRQKFSEKIFEEMALAYGNQPMEKITVDSFAQQVTSIAEFFPEMKRADIDTSLCEAIRSKHGPADFDKIRAEFLDPSITPPHFVAARGAIEAELTAKKSVLQEELNELPEKLKFALQQKTDAERTMNAAGELFTSHCRSMGLPLTTSLANFPAAFDDSDPRLIARIADNLRTKTAAFEAKDRAYKLLLTRLETIAQYDPETNLLCGGQLLEVESKLQPESLDAAARDEMMRNVRFYDNLRR